MMKNDCIIFYVNLIFINLTSLYYNTVPKVFKSSWTFYKKPINYLNTFKVIKNVKNKTSVLDKQMRIHDTLV